MGKHCAGREKFPFWQGCSREALLHLMKCGSTYLFPSSIGELILFILLCFEVVNTKMGASDLCRR